MKRVTEKNMIDYLVKIENKYRRLDASTESFKISFVASSLLIKRNGRDELFGNPYNFLMAVKNGGGGGGGNRNVYSKSAEVLLNDLDFFRKV